MKKSTETISSKDDLSADETWLAILEPELCKDTAAVELLARLLFTIKKEINSGSAGVKRASEILSNGIEVMYIYTNAHKAAIELYILSLEGHLKPQDEPLNLINAAIERGKSQTRWRLRFRVSCIGCGGAAIFLVTTSIKLLKIRFAKGRQAK